MIYLDNNASTQLAPEARAAMEDALGAYGNPSSVHQVGQDARRRLEEARGEIAALIGSRGDEIILTSGGTESNALAIFGACAGKTGRVVISAVEHPSVRECAARLASTGRFEVVAVAPGFLRDARPDPGARRRNSGDGPRLGDGRKQRVRGSLSRPRARR